MYLSSHMCSLPSHQASTHCILIISLLPTRRFFLYVTIYLCNFLAYTIFIHFTLKNCNTPIIFCFFLKTAGYHSIRLSVFYLSPFWYSYATLFSFMCYLYLLISLPSFYRNSNCRFLYVTHSNRSPFTSPNPLIFDVFVCLFVVSSLSLFFHNVFGLSDLNHLHNYHFCLFYSHQEFT